VGAQDESPIYLDCNATTPHAPEVVAAMRPFLSMDELTGWTLAADKVLVF